jgi:hypothetical protein
VCEKIEMEARFEGRVAQEFEVQAGRSEPGPSRDRRAAGGNPAVSEKELELEKESRHTGPYFTRRRKRDRPTSILSNPSSVPDALHHQHP